MTNMNTNSIRIKLMVTIDIPAISLDTAIALQRKPPHTLLLSYLDSITDAFQVSYDYTHHVHVEPTPHPATAICPSTNES